MEQTFFHVGQCGDIIYSLPTVKALGGGTIITALAKPLHDALRPLLMYQPFVKEVLHVSETVIPQGFINLDLFRHYPKLSTDHLVVSHAKMQNVDLPDTWKTDGWLRDPIEIHENRKLEIALINCTTRYKDKFYNWNREIRRMRERNCQVFFMGTSEEHTLFTQRFDYIEHIPTVDLLKACSLISRAKYFTGNQSALLAIAEGLGRPYRMLQSPHHFNCNTYTERETVINPLTYKLHYALSSALTVLRNKRA